MKLELEPLEHQRVMSTRPANFDSLLGCQKSEEWNLNFCAAPLAKLAQGESGVPANLVRTGWVQFLPPPARSMLRAFHQAVCLPLLRFQ